MNEFFGSLLWLAVALGVLVTFHELGHYWVARLCGVQVLRFSVGFGKPLWMRRARDGTEWAISAIPLGGYVKMLGERDDVGDAVAPDARDRAFTHKPVLQRMAIVAAGPVANLVLAVAFFWAMLVIGRPDYSPQVGLARGIAADAGLAAGDTVLAVGERQTPTWSELQIALVGAGVDRGRTPLTVRTAEGRTVTRTLDMRGIPEGLGLREVVREIGLVPAHAMPAPLVGDVSAGGPAAGKLQAGDRIAAIDGTPLRNWAEIQPLIAARAARGGAAEIDVERDGRMLRFGIVPVPAAQANRDGPPWQIGIGLAQREPEKTALLRYGPLEAVPASLRELGYQTGEIFAMFGRAFDGRVKVTETVSGPITIGRAANYFANQGPGHFFWMLAMLSLSIAILNLLPIPVLDGGHLLYYFIELVKGSPLQERTMAAGQYVGLALLFGLMGLAFFNDIHGLLQ